MKYWVMGDLSVDIYGEKSSDQKVLGGTGANIASMISRLGGDVGLVTTVGCDSNGKFLTNALNDIGVDVSCITEKSGKSTSVIKVILDASGERIFKLVTPKSQQGSLMMTDLPTFHKNDHLVISGVSLIKKEDRAVVHEAIAQIKALGGLVFYDANIREEQWEDHRDVIIQNNLEIINKSSIVKLSYEELIYLTGTQNYQKAIQEAHLWKCQCVVITKGAKGCDLIMENLVESIIGIPVKVVDTTGAGDAFIGTLSYLTTINNIDLNKSKIEIDLQMANYAGAIVVGGKGAISSQPTIIDIKNFLLNRN